jgi:predicted metal-dependent TIM-barrel fold hydrolase
MVLQHLVDGHVHADGLRDVDLETLARFGVEQVLVCAHDGALPRPSAATAVDWLTQFDRLLSVELPRFRRHGLRPLFALGIHPASAPWHGLEALLHRLPHYLSHPAVVAVGSLGLRHYDEREQFVLGRQLELAAELRRPVLVSAPVRDPFRVVQKLVLQTRQAGIPADRVLIERVIPPTLPLLRACGFSIALEPSPGRLSLEEIVRAVQHFGPDRFVLSSHAGEGAADPLAVPMVASTLVDAGLSPAVIERVASANLLRFLRRDVSVPRARVG